MPKETAKSGKRKTRRAVVSVQRPSLREQALELAASPRFAWGLIICAVFTLAGGVLAAWAWEQPLVRVGRVADRTRTARVDFVIRDDAATSDARELARQQTPRVFRADEAVLEQIRSSLENLPTTLASLESVDDLSDEIRRPFGLNAEEFTAIKAQSDSPELWSTRVGQLVRLLGEHPLMSSADWQVARQQGSNRDISLRFSDRSTEVPRERALNVQDDSGSLREDLSDLARRAGFGPDVQPVVVARLISEERPTFRFEPGATTQAQDAAASAVETRYQKNPAGTPIFVRGQRITDAQYDRALAERRAFGFEAGAWRVWLPRATVLAFVAGVTIAAAGYVSVFCPRVRRNPDRMIGLALLLFAVLAASCVATAAWPGTIGLTIIAPITLAATVLVIAYDQRTALALGSLLGLMVSVALRQPVGVFALCVAGAGIASWRLGEIRDRKTLISMSGWAAAVLGAGMIVVGFIERPVTSDTVTEIVGDAMVSAFGGVLVGMIALFVLPLIERGFDMTTGMTLIELRDPKQSLLRELQQRAPGTYNHSLNVASIAETAADAIGADPLLTYVGALYHDIGKMNKPEYFVENQAGGSNKHEKLSPAMSLLVIVGHVKDGLEMAREFGLPRTLQHFIEAHHGTTLVEFFYQRARVRAESEGAEPAEIEYRYPGPKPRTKEVAVVMLSDAVESATRTLSEPTPSRIDALVRMLANKRLLDGQFDECDLTLKEMRLAADSISKSVAAIYHGRIAYPGEKKEEKREDEKKVERA